MLSFQFANGDEVANRFGKMIGRIGYFGGVEMTRQMSKWQNEDMHRRRAATKPTRWKKGIKQASTKIRPHSRFEVRRSEAYQAGKALRLKVVGGVRRYRKVKRRSTGPIRQKTSTRPILRQSLYQQFVTRESDAFQKLSWAE